MQIKSILSIVLILALSSAGFGRNLVSNRLVQALIVVESAGRDNAIGDGGAAVGCLQIHKPTVRDANRIIGKNHYKYSDRFNRQKSIEICRIILGYYEYGDMNQAKRWNQGGAWKYDKRAAQKAEKYWKRVKKELDRGK